MLVSAAQSVEEAYRLLGQTRAITRAYREQLAVLKANIAELRRIMASIPTDPYHYLYSNLHCSKSETSAG